MADRLMKILEHKIYLARHLGLSIESMGTMPARHFIAMVKIVDYQRRVEQYHLDYRLGQIMCILTNDKNTKNKPEQFVGKEPTMEVTNMAKAKPMEIVLGDGETYTVPVMDVNMMEAIEDEFDKSWAELFTNPRVKVIKSVLWHLLKRNYPDMTLDQVGTLVTAKVLPGLVKLIGDE